MKTFTALCWCENAWCENPFSHPPGRGRARPLPAALCLALVIMLAWVPAGQSEPPPNPLPLPLFSFDLDSPTVVAGVVGAADILAVDDGLYPYVVVYGWQLGLPGFLDDLDGLSTDHAVILPNEFFALLFSMTRESMGVAPPEQILRTLGRPFNVLDQATRGHAAGDQFMSLAVFTQAGRSAPVGRMANNTQVRNNYDEGGTDFGAVPHVDSYGNPVPGPAPNPLRTLQDNVDATSLFAQDGSGWLVQDVYFTATAGSPSLPQLSYPELPSGANIFYNPDPQLYLPTGLYASFVQLGLLLEDDIDALLVFDTNADATFNGTDKVIFSLADNSPSLYSIPGASIAGADADLFIAAPGQPAMLFAPAMAFGLGHPQDGIDALDLVLCMDPEACSLDFAIQALKGDLNCDGHVDFGDINPFVLALSNPALYKITYPGCFIENGDINMDGFTDFGDINPFVALLTGL